MNNIDAFKKLIETYRNISVQDLIDVNGGEIEITSYRSPLTYITGLGYPHRCKLCIGADYTYHGCAYCVYTLVDSEQGGYKCGYKCAEDTYHAMRNARTVHTLHTAIAKRVEYMEYIVTQYETKYEL